MTRYVFAPQPLWMQSEDTATVGAEQKPIVTLATDFAFEVFSDATGGIDYSGDLTALDGVSPITATTGSDGSTPWMRGPDEVKVMYADTGTPDRWPLYAHDRLTELIDSGASLDVEQTWTAEQTFTGGIVVSDGALPISAVQDLAQQIANAAAEGTLAQQQILDNAVLSVNGTGPDAAGNVNVSGGGGGGTVVSVSGNLPDGFGDVAIDKNDVGLGNVDNTSDVNKPVSTATSTQLATKAADVEISAVNIQSTTSSVRNLISGRRAFDAYVAFFVLFGQYYTLYWSGSAWPALSTVNATYIATGRPIIWDSQTDLAATEPSEARNGDFWDKKIA